MLPLHTHGTLAGSLPHSILKVLTLGVALEAKFPLDRVLIDQRTSSARVPSQTFRRLQFAGVLGNEDDSTIPRIGTLSP